MNNLNISKEAACKCYQENTESIYELKKLTFKG